jgi:predicted O-methyltransferase YrrM
MNKQEIIQKYWHEKGHLNKNQMIYLAEVLTVLQPKNCIEIGFATGRSCITTLVYGSPEKLISIDIDLDYMGARDHANLLMIDFNNLSVIEGNSLHLLTNDFLNANFSEGIDYAFVDGGHGYNEALSDITQIYKHLNNKGIIIVDDYYSGVPDGFPLEEVNRAVDDFCTQNNIIVERWYNNGKGMAVIKKARNKAWLTEGANKFLDSLVLNKELNVLEFGMGASTLWFSDKVKSLTSIEHNPSWFNKINSFLSDKINVSLILFESTQIVNTDYIKDCYSVVLDRFQDETFDFILIDGRNRVECFKKAVRVLKTGGFIMLDNSEREWYSEIFEFYKGHELCEFTQNEPDEFGFYYSGWKTSWWKK